MSGGGVLGDARGLHADGARQGAEGLPRQGHGVSARGHGRGHRAVMAWGRGRRLTVPMVNFAQVVSRPTAGWKGWGSLARLIRLLGNDIVRGLMAGARSQFWKVNTSWYSTHINKNKLKFEGSKLVTYFRRKMPPG